MATTRENVLVEKVFDKVIQFFQFFAELGTCGTKLLTNQRVSKPSFEIRAKDTRQPLMLVNVLPPMETAPSIPYDHHSALLCVIIKEADYFQPNIVHFTKRIGS